MSEHIQITVADGVQTIRMNRPEKKNALTRAMYQTMAEALKAAESDDTIGANVILGVEGAFCAGNDLADFLAFATKGEFGTEVVMFLEQLEANTKPLIAGVDGLAIGVGTTMLMHCDLAFASNRSLLRTPFTDLGLVPEAGSSLLGPRIMGHQRAFALLAMGEDFSADDARDAGLVYKVTAPEALEAETLAAAKKVAAKPRQAMAISRRLLKDEDAALKERIHEETKLFAERLGSDEAKTAFMAFMMKKSG